MLLSDKLAASDDRLIVKVDAPVEIAAGGIVIPEDSREASITGVVLLAGPLSFYQKDERILFSKFAGVDVKIELETYKVLRDSDVIAVFGVKVGRTGYQRPLVKQT